MRNVAISAFLLATSTSTHALAERGPAKGTAATATATKGATDVTAEGFQAAKKKEAEAKDATELSLGAGALSTSGNSRNLALTSLATFRLRRSDDQFSALAAANYGRAGAPGREVVTTVENFQGRARYDRFVTTDVALFLGLQGRRDRFAGLALRTQVDPGVGYYFLNEEKRLLWTELGYDLLHDIRRDDARAVFDQNGARTGDLAKTRTTHSGRLFVGYGDKLNEAVVVTMGVEYLQALTDRKLHRINGDVSISSKIGKGFALATAFSARYDAGALPGKERLDTVTSANLVYTIL
jgi:putative salt-induced outer membrane protein YdiY